MYHFRWVGPFLVAVVVSIFAMVVGFIMMPSPVDPVEFM